jgi:putative SOS response-associated peptidase YedK
MTMAANAAVMPTNDRMPVLVDPYEYDAWLHGGIRDVTGFQHRAPFAAERMVVEQTEDLWRSGKLRAKAQPQLALL